MIEKPKPAKPPVTPEERKHWGEMREPVYQPTLGSRFGNWVVGLLTPWKR